MAFRQRSICTLTVDVQNWRGVSIPALSGTISQLSVVLPRIYIPRSHTRISEVSKSNGEPDTSSPAMAPAPRAQTTRAVVNVFSWITFYYKYDFWGCVFPAFFILSGLYKHRFVLFSLSHNFKCVFVAFFVYFAMTKTDFRDYISKLYWHTFNTNNAQPPPSRDYAPNSAMPRKVLYGHILSPSDHCDSKMLKTHPYIRGASFFFRWFPYIDEETYSRLFFRFLLCRNQRHDFCIQWDAHSWIRCIPFCRNHIFSVHMPHGRSEYRRFYSE